MAAAAKSGAAAAAAVQWPAGRARVAPAPRREERGGGCILRRGAGGGLRVARVRRCDLGCLEARPGRVARTCARRERPRAPLLVERAAAAVCCCLGSSRLAPP
eukprot:scaffold109_cov389-Prasinococcus_capsulatus_cf.AAC.1